MATISYIIFVIIGVIFIALSFFFLLLISKNVKRGRLERQRLAQRAETLRMSRMLSSLGFDFSKYMHNVPMNQIKKSMNNCEDCSTTDLCDTKLDEGKISLDDIAFCPNQECLSQYSETSAPSSAKQQH